MKALGISTTFLLVSAIFYQPILSQTPAPTLAGRWLFEFNLRGQAYRLQFDGEASGEATIRLLDHRVSDLLNKGQWRLGGQSATLYVFNISGAIEFPLGNVGREAGTIDFSASADLRLPIESMRGQGQYHPPRDPNDVRGGEDPFFEFTANRIAPFNVQWLSPVNGERVRRGREYRFTWSVDHDAPVAAQYIQLSTDNGKSFSILIPSLDGEARSFVWAVPADFPKIKKARLKIVVTDRDGIVVETVSQEPFLIK
jgi:hypothetical protein